MSPATGLPFFGIWNLIVRAQRCAAAFWRSAKRARRPAVDAADAFGRLPPSLLLRSTCVVPASFAGVVSLERSVRFRTLALETDRHLLVAGLKYGSLAA